MAIEVRHSPDLAVLSKAARQVGYGQFLKEREQIALKQQALALENLHFQQARGDRAYENSAQRQYDWARLNQQQAYDSHQDRERRAAAMAAQGQEYAWKERELGDRRQDATTLWNRQQEAGNLEYQRQQAEAATQRQQALEDETRAAQEKRRFFNYEITARDKVEMGRLQDAKSRISGNNSLSPEQKQAGIYEIDMRMAGIANPQMVPKPKPNLDRQNIEEIHETHKIDAEDGSGSFIYNPDGTFNKFLPRNKSQIFSPDWAAKRLDSWRKAEEEKAAMDEGYTPVAEAELIARLQQEMTLLRPLFDQVNAPAGSQGIQFGPPQNPVAALVGAQTMAGVTSPFTAPPPQTKEQKSASDDAFLKAKVEAGVPEVFISKKLGTQVKRSDVLETLQKHPEVTLETLLEWLEARMPGHAAWETDPETIPSLK